MKFTQLFRVIGNTNAITYDDGLKSTDTEPKRLLAVYLQCAAWDGNDQTDVQGYHERAKVFDLPAKAIPAVPDTATSQSTAPPLYHRQEVELDIPVGEVFKVAIKCGSTAVKIRGWYEYEIISK
jgi:hypothetical protein